MKNLLIHTLLILTLSVCMTASAFSASHREAPLIALDPAADNTDVYAFRSWENPDKAVFILNTIPGQDPGDGPNYFAFDDDVLYQIHIDNDQDGRAEDVIYQIQFETETRPALGLLNFPLQFIGNPNIAVPELQGITALDGPGSEGLTRRQTYTVTRIMGHKRERLFKGQTLVAVPSNAGPATMPDYEALAAQGIYSDSKTGMRVFAGQRSETFYIDLGAVFDTVNLRRPVPALTEEEDANDHINPFGINRFSGFNISSIAIEVPIEQITHDKQPANMTQSPIIGLYASTSRQKIKLLRENGKTHNIGKYVQISRMANPLVNELIIDTPSKDIWNASEPEDEAQFQEFYKTPSLATALNLIFGLPVPDTPRTDLMQLLLKYPSQSLHGANCGWPCAELLRLNLHIPPTAPQDQKRLGGLAAPPDPAGFPNGRRPNDDVTDIATRVVGGPAFIEARVGDGVNYLADAPGSNLTTNGIYTIFPFLPTPQDGRNRRHIDCAEMDANPCN
ncbi:DUF4331 domain-containing protein [Nitrosomonas sp.]|uniref:DUF4331 domain-containing protein n=1 Tax=Nitrosomonas sp. TaxID=42353 RepID=UPI002085F6E2|nr:DUF4331 domain-containing protein [Nitrosomonas sp.]GJL76316.1 MAG: hypothetical protein NMNS02_24220 [Nitrosomonas sp.]